MICPRTDVCSAPVLQNSFGYICIIKKYAAVVSSAFQVLDIVIDEAKNIHVLERTSFVYFA